MTFLTSAINIMASSHALCFGLSAQVAIWQIKQLGHRLKCQWQNLSHCNLGSWVIITVPQHLWTQTQGAIPEGENSSFLPKMTVCFLFIHFLLIREAYVDPPDSVIMTYRIWESSSLRSVDLEKLDNQHYFWITVIFSIYPKTGNLLSEQFLFYF